MRLPFFFLPYTSRFFFFLSFLRATPLISVLLFAFLAIADLTLPLSFVYTFRFYTFAFLGTTFVLKKVGYTRIMYIHTGVSTYNKYTV